MVADDVCTVGTEKQKKLLQENVGHFSMIKMLHLADLITELNGILLLSSLPLLCVCML